MKKVGLVALGVSVLLGASMLVRLQPAKAHPHFYLGFKKKYVGDEETAVQQAIGQAVLDAKKCNVCHERGNGKRRNAYGDELAKLLTKADKKDKEKIQQALETVAAVKAEGSDVTYGDLLKAGKMPWISRRQ